MNVRRDLVVHITRADIVEMLKARGIIVPINSDEHGGAQADISPSVHGITQMPGQVLVVVSISQPEEAQ
jgi:hypothetical protein